ncbi:hypothetical protein L0664_11035 [Octadecabacter sp. G9-8]|uniref:Uncharacterized protein n=1 Tax=Octadecabacter dasysiphoniae TaxID=2909341 RepID=A0ABS9CXN2_9RHOB|nr:hypothetical protein [Octadecabacter dasysiphoniae]MCF2871599.1 hypothetical protein [Octadecabacter dasysiphoniae]
MIRWLVPIWLFSGAAFAEPVTIRSGEHDSFSRLVLAIGVGSQWEVTPTDGGYFLNLDGSTDGFDTSTVFDRIPRNRLAAVAQRDGDSLFLEVNCACYIDSFLWQPGQLVVDIIEGVDPEVIEGEPSMNAEFATPPDKPTQLPNLLRIREESPPQTVVIPSALQGSPQSSETQMTETALIEGLARAASQGFLNPAMQNVPNASSSPPAVINEEPEDFLEASVLDGQPGVGISTAMDREFALLGDMLESSVGQQCLPADLFEVSTWGDDSAFHSQVADLAEGLAGEFGEEPREAQDALARLYIHFGFGAEARAVLTSDTALSQSRQILNELAGIVDQYPGNYALIAAQKGCSTPAALWAFYVDPSALENDERNHILQQFFALPQPLRGQFAPRLARKFIAINDTDAAAKLLRAAEDHDAEVTHDVQATHALIAEEVDDPERALEVLAQEADDNARITPESLIRLIELALEQGQTPQRSDLALAAAMRQEFRGTPAASALAIAEANGLIALGDYAEALAILGDRDDDGATNVVNNAYSQLTRVATAAVFLEFGYGLIPDAVTADTRNAMARRMIDTGFPERALSLLDGPAEREAAAERRYLRAEAGIESENHAIAIDGLMGMNDARARALRARVYAGLGEHRAALEAVDPMSAKPGQETLQFRAGAWERLTLEEDEILSGFAEAVLAPSVTAPAETLEDRRAILAQSQESRRAVEGLLQRFDGVSSQD